MQQNGNHFQAHSLLTRTVRWFINDVGLAVVIEMPGHVRHTPVNLT